MVGQRAVWRFLAAISSVVFVALPLATRQLVIAETEDLSRGYLTTPQELRVIAEKAAEGIEPYTTSVEAVLVWADKRFDFDFDRTEKCPNADRPRWIDNANGVPVLYAKALAYHLTSESDYAGEVKDVLEDIMSEVKEISLDVERCRLVFAWGIPEVVQAADLIEAYWKDMECKGPASTEHFDTSTDAGNCKRLFQNWLVKNPYYVISYSASGSMNNWGAAATTATAYIADYLWDRRDVVLLHRSPHAMNNGQEMIFTPAQAYAYANKLALDRMNGYRVDYSSSTACDLLEGHQQSDAWIPVKSQITERGIVPDDARRDEYCNIERYDGTYQNYPQVHLGNNIQQCELMLRRGDSSCYDNIDMHAIPDFVFVNRDGEVKTTSLYAGRGSIERGINAIIIDAQTEWRHDSALELAYRYYSVHHQFDGVEQWFRQLDRPGRCDQDACFGTLTHGFAPDESPQPPPTVLPPQ